MTTTKSIDFAARITDNAVNSLPPVAQIAHTMRGRVVAMQSAEVDMAQHEVFLTGGTGFLGRSLAAELLRRGHRVRALARPGSESRVVQGCEVVHGDALRAETYAANIGAGRYLRSSRRSRASQSQQGRGVSRDRSALLSRSRASRQTGGCAALCLSQRGSSGTHDA